MTKTHTLQVISTTQERREQVAEALKQKSCTAQELMDRFDFSYGAISNDLNELRRHRKVHIAGTTKKKAFLWGFGPSPQHA